MAWELLFSSDFGLMSLGGIIFMICMCIFLGRMYFTKMNQESRKLDK